MAQSGKDNRLNCVTAVPAVHGAETICLQFHALGCVTKGDTALQHRHNHSLTFQHTNALPTSEQESHLYTLHNTTHPTKGRGSLKRGRSPGGPRRVPEQPKRFMKGGITCSILHSAALLAARLLLHSVLLAV